MDLRMGRPVGPPRYPGVPMAPEAVARLDADLRAMGFYEW